MWSIRGEAGKIVENLWRIYGEFGEKGRPGLLRSPSVSITRLHIYVRQWCDMNIRIIGPVTVSTTEVLISFIYNTIQYTEVYKYRITI